MGIWLYAWLVCLPIRLVHCPRVGSACVDKHLSPKPDVLVLYMIYHTCGWADFHARFTCAMDSIFTVVLFQYLDEVVVETVTCDVPRTPTSTTPVSSFRQVSYFSVFLAVMSWNVIKFNFRFRQPLGRKLTLNVNLQNKTSTVVFCRTRLYPMLQWQIYAYVIIRQQMKSIPYWNIYTSVKSEFCFRFCWHPSTKSALINFNSLRIFVTIHVQHGNCNCKTAKVGICTPLKWISTSGLSQKR